MCALVTAQAAQVSQNFRIALAMPPKGKAKGKAKAKPKAKPITAQLRPIRDFVKEVKNLKLRGSSSPECERLADRVSRKIRGATGPPMAVDKNFFWPFLRGATGLFLYGIIT